jgi:hypothetical protein
MMKRIKNQVVEYNKIDFATPPLLGAGRSCRYGVHSLIRWQGLIALESLDPIVIANTT